MNFDEIIKEHPLPWSVRVDGRDTPKSVCTIRDADRRHIGTCTEEGIAIFPQSLANFIVWSVNGMADINKRVSDYDNGNTPIHLGALSVVQEITEILRRRP